MIEIQDLEKRYRGSWFRAGYHALRGVTLDVRPGEIFALLGPNGAGKTTLIKVLLGIVRKSSGEARLLGSPAGHQASRRKVGYLPEHLRLPRHHTAETALALLGKLSGMSNADIHARRDDVLQRVGLSKWADVPLRKYSKGMLQRLGLGQALLHEPELLILDEPTDGLDPVGRRSVRTVLESLRSEGKTIFINSHLLQEVELFCDRIA
ncbi:MAG: ABC transporter ATP-binding protein, partial [Planctomycetales bacterium]|nr:ABC transporter ATP-binding protein [Planctomycetales bacterium]